MGYIVPIEKFMNDPKLKDPAMDLKDYVEDIRKASAEWKGIKGFPGEVTSSTKEKRPF